MESNDIKLNDTTHTHTRTLSTSSYQECSSPPTNPKECSNSMRPQKSSLLADSSAVQYEEQQWFKRIRWSKQQTQIEELNC